MSNTTVKVADTLPDKPSEILEVALKDFCKCARMTSIYSIDMMSWHYSNPKTNRCQVCMGGAVMAQSLHVPADQDFSPYYITSPSLARKLSFISSVALGGLYIALDKMDIKDREVVSRIVDKLLSKYTPYNVNPKGFKEWIRSWIKALKVEGY